MPEKILKVNSHQRSGTHLLMEGLSRHFYPKRNLVLTVKNRRDLPYSNGAKTSEKRGIPVKGGQLFCSHSFPEDCEWSRENTIYIRRDGFDVLHSFYKLNTFPMKIKPVFDKWLTEERVMHWVLHVSKWIETGVYVVHFEHLSTEYEKEMSKIADFFKIQHPASGYSKPGPVGWNPGKGAIGQGKMHWSEEKKALLERLKKEFNVE